MQGEFLQLDIQQAATLSRKAAETGSPAGQYTLGNFYACQEKNYKEAREWYQKAADQNLCEAQLAIGYLYSRGLGGEVDSKEAVKWYRKAAEQGMSHGYYELGRYHHLEKNYKKLKNAIGKQR